MKTSGNAQHTIDMRAEFTPVINIGIRHHQMISP